MDAIKTAATEAGIELDVKSAAFAMGYAQGLQEESKKQHPKLEIVYFAVRARAEVPRMLLEYGGHDYEVRSEDVRAIRLPSSGGPTSAAGLASLPGCAVVGAALDTSASPANLPTCQHQRTPERVTRHRT